jgi:hypothetical protein
MQKLLAVVSKFTLWATKNIFAVFGIGGATMAHNSCLWYTEAQISIYFPEGKVCCDLCPLMETYSRKQCRKTGEYLADTRTIGYMCPLKFIEKQEETNNESN